MLALSLVLLMAVQDASAPAWTAPSNPDPQKILAEANADASSGRYPDALAKYVWFHHNALTYKASLYGVRLSFALSGWNELGQKYEPAKQTLETAREEALDAVRKGGEAREAFHDLASINDVVGKQADTANEFRRIDADDPALAGKVFDIARPALVRAREYTLCGKYLRPHDDLTTAVGAFRRLREAIASGKLRNGGYAEQKLTNDAATLVALLVVNGRRPEAEDIATEAKAAWDDAEYHDAIDTALKGQVPEPWP